MQFSNFRQIRSILFACWVFTFKIHESYDYERLESLQNREGIKKKD
ncbi:hypothetical protein [Helicobacter apodemus]|nr:hypothetical protein [Helicobacter apodemus]